MQHLNKTKEFGRTADQRAALWRTMLGSLIIHEKITTTEAKAKELKKRIDCVINKAKKSGEKDRKVNIIRDLKRVIPMIAVKKILGEYLVNFSERESGYARVIKLNPRKSDGAGMAVVELIGK